MLQCLIYVDDLEGCRKNQASRDNGLEKGVGFEDRVKRIVEETAPCRKKHERLGDGKNLCSGWVGERTEGPKLITTAFFHS